MRFENASVFEMGLTFSLLMFLLVFPLNLSAQSSVQQERLTFVRLTGEQYRNSIRDIFGESIEVRGDAVSAGVREAGLTALGDRRLTLSSSEVESFEVLALDIASQVLEPSRRTTLIPCEPDNQNSVDDECASEFISLVGLHLSVDR